MKRYLVLSFDDGPIQDKRFVELLNKYNLPATFNLNSGLEDFVWYYENKTPIKRIKFNECLELYNNHEIASHTVNHPFLTDLDEQELIHQVGDDATTLSKIFNKDITSFAVPFTACNEREIEIIKNHTPIKAIRLSKFTNKTDFSVPKDNYHFMCNAYYNNPDIYDHIFSFSKNTLDKSIFIIVGHSYEFEVLNEWDKIENLLKYIKTFDSFEVVTFKDAIKKLRG